MKNDREFDGFENHKMGRKPPARGADRVPYGRYGELLPILKRLVVDWGVSTRVVAQVFGLKMKSLSARLTDVDAFEERERRDYEVAYQTLAELLLKNELPMGEYFENLSPEWQQELLELLEGPENAE